MSRNETTPTPRLAALDGLRLIAALAVAMYHYTVAWRVDGVSLPQRFLPTFTQFSVYGFLGVELFFLISGFVICMSSWGRSLGDFFTSRVSRLYPAYWICVLITAALAYAVPVTGAVPLGPAPDLNAIAANLTMLQQPLGVPSIELVYWTLFVELCFYLLFAGVVWRGLTYRRVVIFCLVWMTVAVLAPTWNIPLVTILAIPDYAPYFIAGITMYLMRRFGPSPLLWAMVGFAWLISVQRVAFRMAHINPGFATSPWAGTAAITLAYAVLLAVALGWTDRITWRWLTVAGAVTYPFYLLHPRVGFTLMRVVHPALDLPVWALVAGTTVVVAGLAWLVHRFVERPLSRLLRAALRRGFADIRAAGVRPSEAPPPPSPLKQPSPSDKSVAVRGDTLL
jgi:peptidoglycan/LPS O-acetylase OafA/YrhL